MAENPYHRLTRPRRRGSGFIALTYTRASLWLGQDHLLGIDSNGYAETYKRFYFQDIQAITIRLNRRRLIWNWVLGVPTALCLVGWCGDLVVLSRYDLGDWLSAVLVTLLFGIPLLINNLRGPTCTCTLRTAVQTEELPSLSRLRQTRGILDRLRPLIAQAQGQLAPEDIPVRMQAWIAGAAATVQGARPSSGAVVSAPSTALESPEAAPLTDVAAPEDGRAPEAAPNSGPAEAKAPYVVDDSNLPPRIVS